MCFNGLKAISKFKAFNFHFDLKVKAAAITESGRPLIYKTRLMILELLALLQN